jgi:hypothetical protein
MAVEAQQKLTGTYVLGVFQGVSQEDFPKLHVGTFVKDDGTLYEERLEFSPFDPRSGAATLPEGLERGTRIAVRIAVNARGYRDRETGQPRTFVSKKALDVTVLP